MADRAVIFVRRDRLKKGIVRMIRDAVIHTKAQRRAQLTELASRSFGRDSAKANAYLDAGFHDTGRSVFEHGIQNVESFHEVESDLGALTNAPA